MQTNAFCNILILWTQQYQNQLQSSFIWFAPPFFVGKYFAKHLYIYKCEKSQYTLISSYLLTAHTRKLYPFRKTRAFKQTSIGNWPDESHHITKHWWENNLWIHWPFKTILFGIFQGNQLTWRDNQRNESALTTHFVLRSYCKCSVKCYDSVFLLGQILGCNSTGIKNMETHGNDIRRKAADN